MTTGGLTPGDFWTWWAGAPRAGAAVGTTFQPWGAALPTEAGLAARAASLQGQVPPHLLNQLSAFDRTRLFRAMERLQHLQATTGSHQLTGLQRIQNLQSAISGILGEAEGSFLARRLAEQEAKLALGEHAARAAARRPVRPFLGLGLGGAVTLGSVLLVLIVGGIIWQQQTDARNRIDNLPENAEPATIFVGPAASGACVDQIMLENGLTWTDQGWRAPLTLPEPLLYGPASENGAGGDEARYRNNVADWYASLTARVDAAVTDSQARCGTVAAGTCSEAASRALVWRQGEEDPDAYRILASEGRLTAAVWEWERGTWGEGDDFEYDVLVARISGQPGTAVCLRTSPAGDEDRGLLEQAGADEGTLHYVNQGCYWGLGVENENGFESNWIDYESGNQRVNLGTDGGAALVFGEVSCGIGLPASTLIWVEIWTEPGATLAPG